MKSELRYPDVMVVGSGIAGVGAALAAAKTGANVLLVTLEGVIGGDSITGLPLLGVHNAIGERVVGGILNELLENCDRLNGYIGSVCDWRMVHGECVDPNALYLSIAQAFENYGVKVLLNSTVTGVECENGQIKSATVICKDGSLIELHPQFIVDASGDANIAVMAGCPYDSGDNNGDFQPVSLVFRVCNVDFEALLNFARNNPDEILLAENPAIELDRTRCAEEVYKQGYPYIALSAHGTLLGNAIQKNDMFPCTAAFITPTSIQRKEVAINVTRKAGINPCQQEELSDSYIVLSKQVQEAFNFLHSSVPGFKESVISGIAHRIGVRETRRIIGDCILNTEDVKTGRKRSDGIAKGSHHIDIHGKGKNQVRIAVDRGQSYDIPFGCLIPKGSRNFLAAGRCISSSREANGSARVMGTSIATGEAAGTAAAMCVGNKLADVHNLDVNDLRHVLTEHAAILDGTH